ncbi:hypothetical protein GG344DRAFT_64779 [Lentinula edodes]|nr:hypothetical protein GG344DRAFT_64779 [Lentinula edodes]
MVNFASKHRRISRTSSASRQWLPVSMQIAEHNDVALLHELFIDFKQLTRKGELVTFEKTMSQWIRWVPPTEQSMSGESFNICPIDYVNTLNYKAPICPHITNGFFTEYDFIHMEKYNITLKHHMLNVNFASSNLQQEVQGKSSVTERDSSLETFPRIYSNTLEPVEPVLLAKHSLELLAHRPKPNPLVQPSSTQPLIPFYNEDKAVARQNTDLELIQILHDAYHDGVFRRYPKLHPAYDLNNPPTTLLPFDPRRNAGGSTFTHLQHFDTVVGRAIRNLNSTIGLKQITFNHLANLSRLCSGCGLPTQTIQIIDSAELSLRIFSKGKEPVFVDSLNTVSLQMSGLWLQQQSLFALFAI